MEDSLGLLDTTTSSSQNIHKYFVPGDVNEMKRNSDVMRYFRDRRDTWQSEGVGRDGGAYVDAANLTVRKNVLGAFAAAIFLPFIPGRRFQLGPGKLESFPGKDRTFNDVWISNRPLFSLFPGRFVLFTYSGGEKGRRRFPPFSSALFPFQWTGSGDILQVFICRRKIKRFSGNGLLRPRELQQNRGRG